MSVRLELANSEYLRVTGVPGGTHTWAWWHYVHAFPAGANLHGLLNHYASFIGINAKYDSTGKIRVYEYNGGASTLSAASGLNSGWNKIVVKVNDTANTIAVYTNDVTTAVVSASPGALGLSGSATMEFGASNSGFDTAVYSDSSLQRIKDWNGDIPVADAFAELASVTFLDATGAWAQWELADQTDLDDDFSTHDFTAGGTLSAGPDLPGGTVNLVVADATHGHAADSPALTQANTLVVADATHGHAADSPTLSQGYTLSVADALHAHAADSPSLTQANALAVADAGHAHTADAPALTQANTLAVADSLHGHTAETPTLSTALSLAPADALHAHTADNVALSQANTLAVQEAAHGHAAESPTLSFAVILAVADALHAHGADSPALTQAHLLAIADALHAHSADSPTLVQAYLLIVADALHGHTADTVFMGELVILEQIYRSLIFTRAASRDLDFTREITRELRI